jgi:ribosomal protein L15
MMRMPKRGFSNYKWQNEYHVVNLGELEQKLDNNATVDAALLVEAGIIRDISLPVKVLGDGELTKKLKITAAKFSRSAIEKIEKAGGVATVVEKAEWSRATAPAGWKKQRRDAAEAKHGASKSAARTTKK